jgi:sulfatase modifying factor 1
MFSSTTTSISATALLALAVAMTTTQSVNAFDLPESLVMKDIPGGTFQMGSDANGVTAATPIHTVELSAFQIAETETTNEHFAEYLNDAWEAGMIFADEQGNKGTWITFSDSHPHFAGKKVMELTGTRVMKDHGTDGVIDPENPLNMQWIEQGSGDRPFSCKDPQQVDWANYDYADGESMADWPELSSPPSQADVCSSPAAFVQYYGALGFAMHYGHTLPSEAQWEWAAKGGQDLEYATADGTVDATLANYNENNAHPDSGHVTPVKSYAANPYGLYDMGGNVWEWVLDFYDDDGTFYTASADTIDPVNDGETDVEESTSCTGGPQTPYNCPTHVRRGGSWNYHAATLLTGYRAPDFHWRGNDHFGFRIASATASTSSDSSADTGATDTGATDTGATDTSSSGDSDATCDNGKLSPTGTLCCPTTCDTCGGPMCSDPATDCCDRSVSASCADSVAPCKMSGAFSAGGGRGDDDEDEDEDEEENETMATVDGDGSTASAVVVGVSTFAAVVLAALF